MKKFNLLLILILSINLYGQTTEKKLSKGLKNVHNLFSTDMKKGVSCYRIPAMVTAPNGDVVCAIDERVHLAPTLSAVAT